jgi:hypothetical protein
VKATWGCTRVPLGGRAKGKYDRVLHCAFLGAGKQGQHAWCWLVCIIQWALGHKNSPKLSGSWPWGDCSWWMVAPSVRA